MRAASIQPSSYLDSRPSVRSRALSLALAVAITALIVFLMIEMGVVTMGHPPSQPSLTMLQLPGQGSQPTPQPKVAKHDRASRGGPKAPVAPTKPTPVKSPPHPPTPVPWNVIPMSSSEFAASDVASLPSHRGERAVASADGGGGDTQGAGRGGGDSGGGAAGGDELLAVDWYRRPTDAELQPYMPRVVPANGGWGEIACRMIEHYHVEDCRELGETPGSGFSRMMREAAWQFLVLPPRRNGKQQLGAWVRIRYDFKPRDAPGPG